MRKHLLFLFLLLSPSQPHKNSSSSRHTHLNTHIPMGALFEHSLHPPAQYLGSICWVLCLFVLRGPLDWGPCPPASSAYLWPEPTGQGWRMGPWSWGQARERVREGKEGEEGRTQSWVIRGKECVYVWSECLCVEGGADIGWVGLS